MYVLVKFKAGGTKTESASDGGRQSQFGGENEDG